MFLSKKIQEKILFGDTFFATHFLIEVVSWAEQSSVTIDTSWIFMWCIPQNPFFLKTRKLDLCLFYFQGNASSVLWKSPKHQAVDNLLKDTSFSQLLLKLVCDIANRDYILHNCNDCPGEKNLRAYLENLFN